MDNMEGPLPPGKQAHPNWYDTLDRHQSVAFSAKGLRNAPGENNCFLNSAVQVFWHLDVFRRSYRRLTGHLCMGNSCIFCALKVIFTQYQYSDQASLPPDALRKALAETFMNKQRFQLGHMDDAAECFENILRRIHFHIANAYHEDSCSAPHCLPHQKFAMTVFDQLVCICGASSDPLTFHELVHYISTTALLTHCRSMQETGDALHPDRFGLLLRNAGTAGDIRDCPGNCGKRVQIRRTLLNTPDVVSIGLVWDSDRPDEKLIHEVANSIGTTILLQDMFHSVVCKDASKLPKLQLSAIVCYYGKHYSTIVYHTKLNAWIYFDDATVTEIGPRWEHVVEKCSKGRFQPLLLLYSNHNASPIATETAPKKRVMAPGFATTPSKGATENKRSENDGYSRKGQTSRRSLTPNPDMNEAGKSNARRTITPGPHELSPDVDVPQNMNVDHHRQSSFLIAVTGKTDKNNTRQYNSEYAVPKGINPIKQSVPGGQSDMPQRQGMLKHCFYEPSNAERNQYQPRPGQDAVDGYTLSTSDQYRRPAITAPKPSNLPLQANFSRVNDCQRKDSFKKGKDKVRADVIRCLDPSRRESQSSDSDSPQTPPQLPPKISRSHSCHNYDHDSPANLSADNIDIRQHVVMKPKANNFHVYENLENSTHTPVQSGLATLPRNKKSGSSVQSHIQHSRQNLLKGSDSYQSHNLPSSNGGQDNIYHTMGYSQPISHSRESSSNTIVPDDRHSRQNSLSSQISDNSQHSSSTRQQDSSNQSSSQYRNQPLGHTSSSHQREEKPPKPMKPEKKNTVAAQKKKSNSKGQQPPPLPEKNNPKTCSMGNLSPDEKSYISRKTVENVLSYQKLSRQSSTNSYTSASSNASTASNTSFESDNCSLKGSKDGDIPFDRLSLESRQDSGYSGSDRNSSSSTGSNTLDPYTQYFLSKSMIPPKTFNQQAVAENLKKFINPGFPENHRFDQKYTVGYQNNSYYGNQQQQQQVQQNQQYQRSYDQSGDRKQLYDPAIVKSHQSKDGMVHPMTQKAGGIDQIPDPKNFDNQMFLQSGPPGYDEVVSYGSEEFTSLCYKSEDFMDQCILNETTDENCGQAIQFCKSAIDCLQLAMKMPNLSHQSYKFAQMKNNSCILKLRSLQKKMTLRQESNSSTNSSDSARSSPCGLTSSSSNQQNSSHHSSQNVIHSRSSSRDSIDSVIENKNYRKEKINNENEGQNDGQRLLHPSNSSQSLNERTCKNSENNNVDMYATLPRKGRQLANKNQNCQNTDVYKNYLNRQQRNNSPSVHPSNQPPSRSSTPSSENRDSDSSSQTSDQYRMQLPSHQQVKMNKAEIRQLLHNNMIQRHGNQQSSGGQVSQIPRNNTASPSAENQTNLPSQQFDQRVSQQETSSDHEDVRPSVRALASRFDKSGTRRAKTKSLPPMNSSLDNRHRSKSESDFLRMDSKPKSVLSKRKKCKASRPRKSVTFSDNIAMVSAMDHYITDTDTCSGYVSDEEEKYKYQRGAYSDNELDDDDSNTTDSPVEILPGQNCCCLCNKHGCDQGSQFCAKCQLYMSRFQPSEC